MGSKHTEEKPQKQRQPFGYDIGLNLDLDPMMSTQFAEAPVPPPAGPTILSQGESDNITNFLDFFVGNVGSVGDRADLLNQSLFHTEDWRAPAPPTYLGHQTTLGVATAESYIQDFDFPYLFSGASLAAPDVVEGATDLAFLQQSNPVFHEQLSFAGSSSLLTPISMAPQPAPGQQPFDFGGHGIDTRQASTNHDLGAYTFQNMVFGQPNPPPRSMPPPRPILANFGTDPQFSNQQHSYVPSSYNETTEALEADQARILNCLQRTDSAAPSRVTSPILRNTALPQGQGDISPQRLKRASSEGREEEGDASLPVSKRKKSSSQPNGEDENSTEPPAAGSPPRPRKKPTVKKETSPTSPVDPAAKTTDATDATVPKTKKGRSGSGPRKQAKKENLSEQQKRENHIKSEQKRRGIIQEGFAELQQLIPGVLANGTSKNSILGTAADWLVNFLEENEELKRKIASAQGR